MNAGPGTSGSRDVFEEQTYTIETPEHVELVYTVAGPGSRLVAFVVDFLIILLPAVIVLFMVLVIASIRATAWMQDLMAGGEAAEARLVIVLLGVLFGSLWLLSMGYFVVFELAWNGQSPGKRLVDIRVMRDSGKPIGLYASVIRNLMRIADTLPVGYFAAFVSMMVSRNWRRLGDLAAGTIVIKIDRRQEDVTEKWDISGQTGAPWPPEPVERTDPWIEDRFEQGGLVRFPPRFFDLAERFLTRRHDLDEESAATLAEKIARPAMDRIAVTGMAPERFLEMAVAYRRTREGRTS